MSLGDTPLPIPQSILRIQIDQRQVSEYQEGDMLFGLGDRVALIVVYATVEPQAILKLHWASK
jgi:hypothetical protein